MKKIFLTLVLSISTITIVVAQKENIRLSAQEIADYQHNLMVQELKLTEEQENVLKPINLSFAKKQKNLMEEEGSMFGKIGDFKRMKKEKNTELEAILTKEQMKKYRNEVEPKIRKFMRKQM